MILLDLFSGIGGFSLAAETVGMETVAFCEIDPYCQRVLRRHWPEVPIFDDVKELSRESLAHTVEHGRTPSGQGGRLPRVDEASRQARCTGGTGTVPAQHSSKESDGDESLEHATQGGIRCGGRQEALVPVAGGGWEGESLADTEGRGAHAEFEGDSRERSEEATGGVRHRPLVISAGFPCQDISYAGKGAGLEGHRSGLFFEVARLVGELRPEYVLLENVSGLLTRGIDTVLGEMASLGYDCVWACIPACAVGAPHRRDRVWIIGIQACADSALRLQAMYDGILRSLTPFTDLIENGWPTATASDAWFHDTPRNQQQPSTGRIFTGKAGLGLRPAVTHGVWPTPRSSEWKGCGPIGSPSAEHREQKFYLDATTQKQEGQSGSLNPDWVETLMGYPVGYTRPDGEPTRLMGQEWPAGLGAPQHDWEPPRLTTEKRDRANRLKALGNSIVPQVAGLLTHAIVSDFER